MTRYRFLSPLAFLLLAAPAYAKPVIEQQPACAIAPVRSSCTVSIHDETYSGSATSCGNPLQALLENLQVAGVDPEGLTAFCEIEFLQTGNYQTWQVEL